MGVSLCFQLGIAVCAYVGTTLVAGHQLGAGYLVAFFLLSVVVASSLGQLPGVLEGLKEALQCAIRVHRLLDMGAVGAEDVGGLEPDKCNGEITFSEVSFKALDGIKGCAP